MQDTTEGLLCSELIYFLNQEQYFLEENISFFTFFLHFTDQVGLNVFKKNKSKKEKNERKKGGPKGVQKGVPGFVYAWRALL